MNWNHWIRQLHRWFSVLFTVAVIANFVQIGMNGGRQVTPNWITYSPLLPLFFMFLTGAWMFILPYAAKGRRGATAGS